MIKLVSGIAAGCISAFLGVYIVSLYFQTQERGSSPILLGLAGVFVLMGATSIFMAVKSRLAYVKSQEFEPEEVFAKTDAENVLQKNNAMMNEYNKTANARDKLKVLQAAGAAEEA